MLTTEADAQAAYQDGMQAGLDNEYVEPGDDRVIAHTSVVGGGDEVTITFDTSAMQAGGNYKFFCSFPGHFPMMNGTFGFGQER
ncbi:MAG: azurin [Xanthomonadaceae bacterium]|nr:azurin [Xanthomonadaceae bacterium]